VIKPEHLTLHDLIIHKVDHLNFTKPFRFEITDIGSGRHLPARDQIILNREHEFSRIGVFTTTPAGKPSMKQLCDALLTSDGKLVSRSQEIALITRHHHSQQCKERAKLG
jgi:hypothetical protein